MAFMICCSIFLFCCSRAMRCSSAVMIILFILIRYIYWVGVSCGPNGPSLGSGGGALGGCMEVDMRPLGSVAPVGKSDTYIYWFSRPALKPRGSCSPNL